MSSTFHAMMASQQPGIGKAKVGKSEKEKAEEKKTGITITVAIFFDGTLNNRTNTTERINQSAVFNKMDEDGSSYDNYYSNVAILEYMNSRGVIKDKQISIYIEGEGTEDRLTDKSAGYMFGEGDTGIPAKVSKGIKQLADRFESTKLYNRGKERIEHVTVSVFGFSRGAAAARHFIARKAEWCTRLGIAPTMVGFHFVGLFDTVSSYGVWSFADDVAQLQLRLTDPAIAKVVHLVAGDEYRQNFASTSIASAIAAGVGYELVLPGAHSDIGGGYAEVEDETRGQTWEELEQLVAAGWYRKEQVNLLMGRGSRTISYHYQLIPLGIMARLATTYGMLLTADTPPEVSLTVPAALLPARAALLAAAVHNDGAHRKRAALVPAVLHPVRNGYLHRSVSAASGMNGYFEDGKPARIPIDG